MTQHVLLVEDHLDLQMILQTRLELAGYTVSLAQNGLEALEWLEKKIPDIILLDLGLPLMDGYAFLEVWEKKELHITLPIIVLTADQQAVAKLAKKAIPVFTKPFAFERLLEAIKRYTRSPQK